MVVQHQQVLGGVTEMSKGVDYLLSLNARQSALFTDPGAALERRKYRAEHPTEIGFIKCMDGRVHGPMMTKIPFGIIQPWRNLGGKFDLGWFGFAQSVREWVSYSVGQGRNCLVFVTYHYARGDKHRGCRGFNYDVHAAQAFTSNLKNQFDRVFGRKTVFAIQCGVETDLDALVFHGDDGTVLDLAQVTDVDTNTLTHMLQKLYPTMPEPTLRDLLPLVQGNIARISEIKASNRPITDAEHREWIIGVGRGFDWLHEVNTALIVGPYDPNMAMAIQTAATLVKGNVEDRRVSVTNNNGLVLLSSAAYRDSAGPERLLAVEKAHFLDRFSYTIIQNHVPEILPHLQRLVVTVDLNTRKIDVLTDKTI